MSVRSSRRLLAVAIVTAVASGIAAPQALASTSGDTVIAAKARVAMTQSRLTGASYVRFEGGYYDATTDEVYIDAGMRVARLSGAKLIDETGTPQPMTSAGGVTTASWPAICNDTTNLTHCEQSLDKSGCRPTYFYLNYVGDDFRDPWGDPIYPYTWINVRNQPYRRYGPRGVRVYYQTRWGFMSGNCLSGGL